MNATATEQVIGAGHVNDEQLLGHERAAASGRASDEFERFFTSHHERLVRTLTAVAGDRDEAADAVQDAFVRAHLRWRKVRALDDPAGWVRRVAINRLNDHHRRQQRKRRLLGVLSSRHETSVEVPPVDEFDRLLAELPRQQRAVTAMFYVDGSPVADIATTLGLSEGSVKSHLHDARRSLRRVIEAEGFSPSPPRHAATAHSDPTPPPPTPTHTSDDPTSPWSRP